MWYKHLYPPISVFYSQILITLHDILSIINLWGYLIQHYCTYKIINESRKYGVLVMGLLHRLLCNYDGWGQLLVVTDPDLSSHVTYKYTCTLILASSEVANLSTMSRLSR